METRETKEGYFTRRLYELKIGEQEIFNLVINLAVTRIPGGWLMGYASEESDNNDVFVPLSSEGQEVKIGI